MDSNNDLMIVKHLEGLITHLQNRLAYPKNSWQRQQNLNRELIEAEKRLAVVSKLGRRNSSRYSRSYPPRSREQDFNSTPRPNTASREVSYL